MFELPMIQASMPVIQFLRFDVLSSLIYWISPYCIDCKAFPTLVESLTFGYEQTRQFRHNFSAYGSYFIFIFLIGNNQSKPSMMSAQFPVEVWATVFSYLDFQTLQKKTTLVCKHWHEMIRSDPTLSGHLALHPPLKPPDPRWT